MCQFGLKLQYLLGEKRFLLKLCYGLLVQPVSLSISIWLPPE